MPVRRADHLDTLERVKPSSVESQVRDTEIGVNERHNWNGDIEYERNVCFDVLYF